MKLPFHLLEQTFIANARRGLAQLNSPRSKKKTLPGKKFRLQAFVN